MLSSVCSHFPPRRHVPREAVLQVTEPWEICACHEKTESDLHDGSGDARVLSALRKLG